MKKRLLTCSFLLLLLSFFAESYASHEMGAEMEFECMNTCTVRLHFRAYRDCTGANLIGNVVTWTPTVSGCTAPSPVTGWSSQVTLEVTPVCPSVTTWCNGSTGMINGVQEYSWYRDYDICSGTPCVQTVTWADCCRNPAITSLANPGSQGMVLANITYNTALGSCNNSPKFSNMPIFYACSNMDYDIHQGGYDPDGDSLSYDLGPCFQSSPNTPVNYASGYSATQPFGPNYNVSIDPVTGILHIDANPGGPVVAVVCIYISEWRNGTLINSYQRDMQVTTLSCSNNTNPSLGAITNLTNGYALGDDIFICTASQVCFDLPGNDPDVGQNLRIFWDGQPVGASFVDASNASIMDTILGTTAAPPTASFCWTPPGNGTYSFRVRIEDNACPVFGISDRIYTIHVGGGAASATATPVACPDVSFVGSGCGAGPFTYSWTGAGGLSNTAQSFTHTYPSAGSYPWQVIISNGTTTDTIMDTVIVGMPQVNSALLSGTYFTAPCVGITHDTILGPSGYSSYLWNTGATSQDLRVFIGGTYSLTVTEPNGCQSYDSTELYWAEPYIYGIVNSSLGAPLMNQKILLIKHDTVNNYLSRLDSAYTDSAGYYYFCNTYDTVMYIKALPSIFAYPLEMPTYADSTLFWYNAIPFYGLTQVPFRHDFATISGLNPGGLGFIGGYVSLGANKTHGVGDPVVGLNVFLHDRNTGALIGQSITNPFGYFSFSNLPAGDYEFKVDVPDMYNPNPPSVTLGAGQMLMDSLDFRLHSTYLELVMATSLEPIPAGFRFQVVPNPFQGSAELLLSLDERMTLELEILDAQGRLLQELGSMDLASGLHRVQVGANLPSGIYFAKLKSRDGQQVVKVLKL